MLRQKRLVPGHQIAEMALVKLYLVTGDRKYLDQAKFFLDARGYTGRKDAYSQHKPVIEQDEAVNAVRAVYMSLAWQTWLPLREIALHQGHRPDLGQYCLKNMYITGGIGARHHHQERPVIITNCPIFAYCETCAAIGSVYMNSSFPTSASWRCQYFDARAYYNG